MKKLIAGCFGLIVLLGIGAIGIAACGVGGIFVASRQYEADQAQLAALPKFTQLPSYQKSGKQMIDVIVDKNISKTELIDLANHLHEKYPYDLIVHFFDDQQQLEEFRQSDMNPGNPNFQFPEKWAAQHDLALILELDDNDGRRWELQTALSGKLLKWTESPSSTTIAVLK